MSTFQKVLSGFSILAFLAVMSLPAGAGGWSEETKVTFTGPVEVPGRVLPAGKYILKLFNSDSERNIVEIWNGSGTRLLCTTFAVFVYRERPTGNAVVTLEERGGKTPEAVHTWFYPGNNLGLKFVYPKIPTQGL
ncbi:MAG TPA: hypothetical protein VEG63_11085 [Candidatus Acidoferrales bacterium]|nr:hypothetical protein [Candidatus Acidoferrales bacterium]